MKDYHSHKLLKNIKKYFLNGIEIKNNLQLKRIAMSMYNEENGKKTAIIQVYNTPKVEGVIIVANGVDDSEIKQKISTAIGNLLGVASYKVQVFAK